MHLIAAIGTYQSDASRPVKGHGRDVQCSTEMAQASIHGHCTPDLQQHAGQPYQVKPGQYLHPVLYWARIGGASDALRSFAFPLTAPG